ncbi:hypothetical protein JCM16303_000177, partial [Sporobolomyces ruberrimus]
SYFGVISSGEQAHAIIEASKLGLLPRVTRRLTDEERIRFVRAGAVFVWEEEEAGIRRWTDHIKWSPSRVSGAFLTYTEVPSKGVETLVKQSFSSVDPSGTKMHLIAYNNKMAHSDGTLPTAAHDPLIQGMLARRSNAGRDPRQQPGPHPSTSASDSAADGTLVPNPAKRRQYRGSHPALPPMFPALSTPTSVADTLPLPFPPPSHIPTLPPMLLDPRQRPQSISQDYGQRPRSASSLYERRPRTSSSEPRPSSSYDSPRYPGLASSAHTSPLPSYGSTPSSSSGSVSSRPHHSLYPSFGHQREMLPLPRPSTTSTFDIPPGYPRLPALYPEPNAPYELPTPPRIHANPDEPTSSQVSTFSRRESGPYPALPPILPISRHPSPPVASSDVPEERVPLPVEPQSRRGIEDERLLRLLGRTL